MATPEPLPASTSPDDRTTIQPEAERPPATPSHQEVAFAAPRPPAAGVIFGDYELLSELGRGGMGIVFKARHNRLNRTVAVKMLLPGAAANAGDVQRFRIEVEATAGLQHPNIVRVHEVGEVGGRPFFSMDLIDGSSLAQRLASGPLPGKVAARYLLAVARAIEHAHQHGILHRDLKPSNILLDAADCPYVTDFGLAKRLGSETSNTQTGAILGTPSSMAPEQAAGRKGLTRQTDVYGLGALLYELLTGRPPFRAETALDTLLQVLEQEPAPPRLLNHKIDRDLETICLKCLEKDPGRRYASAAAVAADLEQYLADGAISARSINLLDRLARTLGRSADETEFLNWGTLALWTGGIIFLCHTALFVATQLGLPSWIRWVAGAAQFALIGTAFWRHRPGKLLPTSPAERQLWSIWIGYFLAFGFTVVIQRQVAGPETIGRGALYPFSAMLTGLAFFVMGSTFWGGCYLIGLAFFVLAALMPGNLTWAPLEFALLWSVTLFTIGLRLRRLGAEARRLGNEKTQALSGAAPKPSTQNLDP